MACKSSSEGTFLTKQLITTIVTSGMLRVNNNTRQGSNASSNLGQANNIVSNNNNRENHVNDKWVINLSKDNLTQAQVSVLAKGPNFSIAPNNIPNMDYITAVESMCGKLKEEDAMALRTDINALLRKAKMPKPNLTKEERTGLAKLKKDKDRVVLIADKGVAMVVMDKQEYINKAEELLAQPAYGSLPRDPTNKIKAQLIAKLGGIKRDNNLDEVITKPCIPPVVSPQSFIDYQKFTKLVTLSGQLFQVGVQLLMG